MRIAITSLYLPSGSKIGVGYQVHHLANALVRRGHQVTVFSQTGASGDSLYKVDIIPPRQRCRSFRFAWDLRTVDFSSFDVLNAHGDDWFLWGKHRPRHVHTFHGSCLAEMLNAPGWRARARMGALALCEMNSLFLADETVAVSENTRKYIPGIRHVIPCGVDTGSFRPGNVKATRPTVLFVGTMHGRKRGRMLVDLFRQQVRLRIKDAEMWCVCERPEGENDGDGVQFLGRVDHEILLDLYRRAWVFCLPSTYEGFGVPYIEALASGTAVLASPNPGAREVLGDGKWGVISSDDQITERLQDLLQDDRRRSELAVAGLQRAQDFSWDSVCLAYERLYAGEQPSQVTPGLSEAL